MLMLQLGYESTAITMLGKSILLNRMYVLNNRIDKTWLSLSLDTFKVKSKDLFLK